MSAVPERRKIIAEISRLDEAIRKMTDEQANARGASVYLLMSKAETKAYDSRGEQIKELREKLDHLKGSL